MDFSYFIILTLIAVVAYFASVKLYISLHKKDNKRALPLSMLCFAVCFMLMLGVMLLVALSNVRYER